jgi:hypothetical protein
MTVEVDSKTKFARWKDFSTRMARTCYAKRQSPSMEEIEADIDSFFEDYVSEEYAELYVNWDHSKNFPGQSEGPGYVCDMVSDLMEYVWRHPYDHATKRQTRLLNYYWDRAMHDEYDEIKESIVERWESPVSCCIRAGIDFAYEQSAGVLGFTAGDLRGMYPEGVPDWIKSQYQGDFEQIPSEADLLF